MFNSIKKCFSEIEAKKILGNKDNAIKYLSKLPDNKIELKKLSTKEVWEVVVKTWDYEISKNIIRELFKESPKYKAGKESATVIDVLLTEWNKLNLGEIKWPCSQGDFDNFVQKINSQSTLRSEKDEEVKIAAVKYRRLKELNTARNDYLETLLFEKNNNIVPTLKHNRGADFYIDGVSFDQKVAKSPTQEFIKKHGDNWKEVAKKNPVEVAEHLYRLQDEGRFGYEPRLFVVYVDEDIPVIELKSIIDKIDVTKPIEVTFTYKHEKTGEKTYKTYCFMVLLYRN